MICAGRGPRGTRTPRKPKCLQQPTLRKLPDFPLEFALAFPRELIECSQTGPTSRPSKGAYAVRLLLNLAPLPDPIAQDAANILGDGRNIFRSIHSAMKPSGDHLSEAPLFSEQLS